MRGGKMLTIEIYWDDLTSEKQQEIRELLNLEPNDNNNWDLIPITTIEIEPD